MSDIPSDSEVDDRNIFKTGFLSIRITFYSFFTGKLINSPILQIRDSDKKTIDDRNRDIPILHFLLLLFFSFFFIYTIPYIQFK